MSQHKSINYTRKRSQNIVPADLFCSATSEIPVNTNNYCTRQPSPSSKMVLLYLLCVSEIHFSVHQVDTMGYGGQNLKIIICKGLAGLHRLLLNKGKISDFFLPFNLHII